MAPCPRYINFSHVLRGAYRQDQVLAGTFDFFLVECINFFQVSGAAAGGRVRLRPGRLGMPGTPRKVNAGPDRRVNRLARIRRKTARRPRC